MGVFQQLIAHPNKMLRSIINLLLTKLDLEGPPPSVTELDNGVDFKARIVMVVTNRACIGKFHSASVDIEVSHA